MRQTHELIQGTPEWHEFRANHFGASEASAMLGISPYQTRTDLLKFKKTGIAPERSPAQQRVLDNGHEVEPLGRALAQAFIGDDLKPRTFSDGEISCSCDGITIMEDVAWECKQYSKDLLASVRNNVLPDHHQPQVQQIMLVTGAEKVLFTCTGGTEENTAHMWVYPDKAYQQRIVAGWAQFKADLQEYEYVEERATPVGKAPEALPALRIEVTGMVTASNIDAFKSHAVAVFGAINLHPRTDEELADAEKTIKFCKEVEDRLDAAQDHALSQTESIDALFRVIAEIKELSRQTRLTLDKVVKNSKDTIRAELIQKVQKDLDAYVADINQELGSRLLHVSAPFADSIKGKKSIASIEDALKTTLANAKIEAAEKAAVFRGNFVTVKQEHWGLLHDFATVGALPAEQFAAVLAGRIADDEQRRAAAAAAQATPKPVEAPAQVQQNTVATPEKVQDKVMPATSKDDVDAFMAINSYGKNEERIRQILTEFVSFQKSRQMLKAA